MKESLEWHLEENILFKRELCSSTGWREMANVWHLSHLY